MSNKVIKGRRVYADVRRHLPKWMIVTKSDDAGNRSEFLARAILMRFRRENGRGPWKLVDLAASYALISEGRYHDALNGNCDENSIAWRRLTGFDVTEEIQGYIDSAKKLITEDCAKDQL